MCNAMIQEAVCVLNSIDSATVAAWVQAIGAIAALAVAIWLQKSQNNAQIEREEIKAKRTIFNKYSLAISLGGGIAQKISELDKWVNSATPNDHVHNLDLMLTEIQSMRDDIIAIDLNAVYPFETTNKLSQFKTFSNLSFAAIDDAYRQSKLSPNWSSVTAVNLERFLPEFTTFMHKSVDYEKVLRKEFNIRS